MDLSVRLIRFQKWLSLCWAATRPPSSTKTKQQRLKKKKVSAIFSSFLSLNWMSFCNEVLTFWPLLHATNFLHLSNLYIRLFNMHRNHNPVLPFKFSHSWPTGVSPDALCATKRWESDSSPPPPPPPEGTYPRITSHTVNALSCLEVRTSVLSSKRF